MTADQPTSPAAPAPPDIDLRNSLELIATLGHYSHVAVHAGVAYVSDQLSLDPTGTPLTDPPFDTQVQQALNNLHNCLITAGSCREQLLSVTVYVTDIDEGPAFDAAYAQSLCTHRPSRAVACVADLHYGAAAEVQAGAGIATA